MYAYQYIDQKHSRDDFLLGNILITQLKLTSTNTSCFSVASLIYEAFEKFGEHSTCYVFSNCISLLLSICFVSYWRHTFIPTNFYMKLTVQDLSCQDLMILEHTSQLLD